ncbi:MAG TPA: enoyl-CoA hydratase [Candidatus Competibacteraceae bacterium]|mgnify:CR=1 FL=1|nr:enoyl-CoA hydratase [Candidatus Competibacteraceae bacterium]
MTIISSSQDALVLRQDEAGVATLTLNRPKHYNALSTAMLDALQAALNAIAADESIQVVVIAGSGPAFCAGHDLKEMRAQDSRAFHQALFTQCGQAMLTINRLPQPVIARVHGIATAAGCQLVAACDLAVASDNARFATSGINVGLFCSSPGVALSRNLGRKQALELLLTGDFIDAQTALQQGLINRVVPLEQLDAAVWQLAGSICNKSQLAIRMGKELFYRQLDLSLEDAYACATEIMACNLDSEDAREGIDAFIGKRKPQWKGC